MSIMENENDATCQSQRAAMGRVETQNIASLPYAIGQTGQIRRHGADKGDYWEVLE